VGYDPDDDVDHDRDHDHDHDHDLDPTRPDPRRCAAPVRRPEGLGRG
jgi:hypothetical protein